MKRIVAVVCLGVLALASMAVAGPGSDDPDLVLRGMYINPAKSDAYDQAYGAELQLRFWVNPNVGLALAAGYQSWQIKEGSFAIADSTGIAGVEWKGSVNAVPLGASLVVRPFENDTVAVTLEGGARYAIMDSQIEVNAAAADIYGNAIGGSVKVDLDDSVLGVVGGDLEVNMSDAVFFTLGVGYQFEISTVGDLKVKNEVGGFFARAGLGFNM